MSSMFPDKPSELDQMRQGYDAVLFSHQADSGQGHLVESNIFGVLGCWGLGPWGVRVEQAWDWGGGAGTWGHKAFIGDKIYDFSPGSYTASTDDVRMLHRF